MARLILRLVSTLAVGLVLLVPVSAAAQPNKDHSIVLEDVSLGGGVTAEIHLKVFVNENQPCRAARRTHFAVHGLGHSAPTWGPLAEELFENNPAGLPVCRVIAIDLPGHGASPPPVGRSYSDLSLQDYVTSIAAALDRLREMGHSPRTIVGHSQGSVLVAMLQQRMLDQGTTIREMFGIVNAVLLTPTPPAGLPWLLVDTGAHLTIIGAFLLPNDPVLGDVVFIPGAAWPAIFFSNFAGQVAPGTPPVAVLDTFAFPEPLLSTLELTGTAPVPSRPQVEVGAFQDLGLATRVHGTVLSVIGFEQDILVRASEAAAVYDHLAGTTDQRRFAVVSGAGAVHDMLISDPRGLLEAVAGTVRF